LFNLLAPTIISHNTKKEADHPELYKHLMNFFQPQVKNNPAYLRGILSTLRHFPLSKGLEEDVKKVGKHPRPVMLLWVCGMMGIYEMLQGKKDKTVPFSCASRYLELVPNAKLVEFENGNHNLLFFYRKEILEKLDNFMKQQ
jgi:hypothetical protein